MKQYIRINLIAVALMAMGSVCTQAQTTTYETESETRIDSIELHYTNKYYSRFFHNWSIDLMGSARVAFAEEDGGLGFGKRIRPAIMLGLQKDISPDISFRVTGSLGDFKGWNTGSDGLYKTTNWSSVDPIAAYKGIGKGVAYEEHYRYFTVGADAMFNLWNIFTSKNQLDRNWTPYFFTGVELFQMLKYQGYHSNTTLGGHAGFKCDLRLGKRVSLTGEAAATLTSATFDNQVGKGHTLDWYAYAALGLKIKLGKQGYRQDKVIPADEYARLGDIGYTVSQQYKMPTKHTSTIGSLFAPSVVFDEGATTYSEELQMANIYRMANYLKENSSLKVSVIGNTHKASVDLAKKRAEIVRQILIDRYHIDGSRLVVNTLDVNAEYDKQGGDNAVNFGPLM